MKYLLLPILTITIAVAGFAQDSIRYRVIFIGDAGKMNEEQRKVFQHATNNILEKRTTIFYLDENLYLEGKAGPDSKEGRAARNILRLQYESLETKEVNVYFISANQDWNKPGTVATKKISTDSLLKIAPGNACPDPVEINLADSLTIIVFNSEWWLFPSANDNIDDSCECKTKSDVLARMDELRYKNKNKFILFTSRHHFQSY